MSRLSMRQRLARRSLNVIYNHHGQSVNVTLPGGNILSGQIAKVDIIEAEQTVDGSRVEVDMKGYTARFRRHCVPDEVLKAHPSGFPTGTRLEFDPPVLEHIHFHVDGKPQAFNRDGGQFIVQMTPTGAPDAATVATDPSGTVVPAGLPLG